MTSLVLALAMLQTPTPGIFELPASEKSLHVKHALRLAGVGRSGRIAFPTDTIQQQIVDGTWKFPKKGEKVARAGTTGEQEWKEIKSAEDGWFTGEALQGGGYVWINVKSAVDRTMILDTAGHSLVYVNDQIRTGDPYQFGYLKTPIKLRKGDNSLLFSVARGRLNIKLDEAPAEPFLNLIDLTTPDAVQGVDEPLMGGVVVVNPKDTYASDLTIEATTTDRSMEEKAWRVPPLGARKVMFRMHSPKAERPGIYKVYLKLKRGDQVLDAKEYELRVQTPDQSRRETFISNIDGSVQYYAIVPAKNEKPGNGLVLSLHGASVEAIAQADSYAQKEDYWIVSPTNRRPFGFDWEDWGRMDALEVLEVVRAKYKPDDKRIYLTGHSMGGHGTWNLGVNFPDKFAVLAPSAGWQSFFDYGGKPRVKDPDALEALIERATALSDTLEMGQNFANRPIYILHGDKDDNVPYTQAKTMHEYLKAWHTDVQLHTEKGANHWWDGQLSAGADCVDWPGFFKKFDETRLGLPAGKWSFTTFNPAVTRSYYGYEVLAQIEPMKKSMLEYATAALKTTNVKTLRIPSKTFVDDQELEPGDYELRDGKWTAVKDPVLQQGPFKELWQNRFLIVYGTTGSVKENDWMLNKARYDAESFAYRGNGSVEILTDEEFLTGAYGGRNVVLVGNSKINKAWAKLMSDAEIQVDDLQVKVGSKIFAGPGATALFWHQPKGLPAVVAIGVTGDQSMRSVERAPYFTSGVGFPDWTVYGSDVWMKGVQGALGVGYYTTDGRLSTTTAWR